MGRGDHRPSLLRWDVCWHPEGNELLAPLIDAVENLLGDACSNDDLADELLGALTALGGSAGNGRLRETLEWDEASYEAVKADLLSRQLIVSGRGRGGSVALADGSELEASGNGQGAGLGALGRPTYTEALSPGNPCPPLRSPPPPVALRWWRGCVSTTRSWPTSSR